MEPINRKPQTIDEYLRLGECRSSRRPSKASANDPRRGTKRGGMYQLRNSRVPSEWARPCWVRRLVKPLLVLPDEFQDVEKVSERAKEFSDQQRHASLLSRQTDAGRIGEEAA